MAKRFGRNQRRQMREQITRMYQHQAEAMDNLGRVQKERQRLADRLTAWAKDIAHLLGPESAFNEQVMRQEVRDVHAFGDALRMLLPVKLVGPTPSPEDMPQFASVGSVIEAAIYLARVHEPMADKMRRELRIVLESRNGDLAYAMNDDRHCRWSPQDINFMARMIAEKMAEHLATEDRRKRA